MSKVVAIKSMSLDGYVADPDDGVAEAFDWYFTSGPSNSTPARQVVAGLLARGAHNGDGTECAVFRYWTVSPDAVRQQWAQLLASLSPEDRVSLASPCAHTGSSRVPAQADGCPYEA